jgi:hypothetical protein
VSPRLYAFFVLWFCKRFMSFLFRGLAGEGLGITREVRFAFVKCQNPWPT